MKCEKCGLVETSDEQEAFRQMIRACDRAAEYGRQHPNEPPMGWKHFLKEILCQD